MLEELSRKELLNLIYTYNKYVMEYFEEHEEGNPVCIEEFYQNEYQELDYSNKQTYFIVDEDITYLRDIFIREFNIERLIRDIMDLCKQEDLKKYIVDEFKSNIELEEFRNIFNDLSDEDFIDFINDTFDYEFEDIDEYNDECDIESVEDILENLEQQLYYLEDIVTEYETKGRGDKENYVWALGEIGKVKSRMASLEEN